MGGPFEDSALTVRGPDPAPPAAPQGTALARQLADAAVEVPAASPAGRAPGERYEVLGVLGQGGMGVVLAARDRALGRRVALKVARGALSADLALRFLAESQITAQLDHPGVVPVYGLEAGPDGEPAYAMKLVLGRGLDEVVDEARRLPPDQAEAGLRDRLEAFLRASDAVAFAHRKGVVHRDLKPANIMVGRDGEVYVVDWGLAKVRGAGAGAGAPPGADGAAAAGDDPTARTHAGMLVGTPAYMAPEQALGEHDRVGPHSDQVGLGLILHELVHLQRAYSAPSITAALDQAVHARRAPPARPGPAELEAIVARATAIDPAGRYPSVGALAEDVRRVLRGEAPAALPDSPWRALVRRAARRPGRLVGGALVVVVTAAALVVAVEARRGVGLADARARAAAREQHLTEALGRVAERAQRVTTDVAGHEALVEGLAGSAAVALAGPPPAAGAAAPGRHGPEDFEDPDRAPADVAPSARYGRPVSLEWPVVHAPASTPAAAAGPEEARLLGLRDRLAAALRTGPDGALLGPGWRERVRAGGAAVAWAYVASEGTGAIALLPGMRTTWTATYDPRQRPWYRAARDAWQRGVRGRTWSAPYVDGLLRRPVVACVAPVTGPAGELLGVAAIDLDAEALARRCLEVEGLTGARRVALLDARGDELLASGEDLAAVAVEADGRLRPRPHPYPGVVDAVRAGRSGQTRAVSPADRRDVLLVWTRLTPLEWTLVVELDGAAVDEG